MKTIDFFCFIFFTNFILILNDRRNTFPSLFIQKKKKKLHLLDQFHLDLERFMFPIFRSITLTELHCSLLKQYTSSHIVLEQFMGYHITFFQCTLIFLIKFILSLNDSSIAIHFLL